jgi:uncharacterized protein (TIGR04206 family)
MAWVNERYAGEVAVLLTWLLALAPWAVTWFRQGRVSVAAFRFLPFRLQYVFGVELENPSPLLPAWEVAGFQSSAALTLAGHVGTVAFLLGLAVVGLSVAYYRDEDAFERRSPIHPVRLFGWLHAGLAVVSLAATALFARYHVGVTVPVGALCAVVFAYLLLTADIARSDEPV